jgi:hypothetical protein
MWIAWLSPRLPRSDSRQGFRPPEDTPAGAVPLQAAKWSRLGNRNTWRTSPITVPAMTGPAPNRPVRLVPEARTAAASFLLASRSWASRRRDVGEELGGQLAARLDDRIRWPHLLKDPGGLAGADLPADPAGHQAGQHRVQPARGLVTGPGQVAVPLGPHLQHGGVVLGEHRAPGRGPQRRDRHRPGIVGVVLVGVTGLQQPHPGRQLGRHIQHLLTGSDQLLGQQMPQPGRALHRPGPPRPPRRPRQQLLRPGRAGVYLQLTQRLLTRADRHRGVRALMRAGPDHHFRHQPTPGPCCTRTGRPRRANPITVRARARL